MGEVDGGNKDLKMKLAARGRGPLLPFWKRLCKLGKLMEVTKELRYIGEANELVCEYTLMWNLIRFTW